jgi:nucleotide-binding universal stress UspA family protein
MYKSILVPLDGSMRAEVVLPHVEDLAHRYGASVILIRVVDLAPPIGAVEKAYATLRQQELDRHTQEAQSYLAVLQGVFREKGLKVETHVAYGPAVDAIIKAARRYEVDLIALASHGWGGVTQVFHGGVTTGVLQRADRPLLLVPSRDQG